MIRPWLAPSLLALALTACDDSSPVPGNEANRQADSAAGSVANETGNAAAPGAMPQPAPEAPDSRPSPPAAPRSASGYRIIGTEPFWGGTVSSDEIVYSTPDNQSGEPIAVNVRFEGDREIYSGALHGRPFVLTLTAGPCSDGMSDNVHAFTATLEVDGETRRGCANPRIE